MKSVVENCLVLTEYELGRAVTAIEWVARGGKPIVEIGQRCLSGDITALDLAHDLDRCIALVGEPDVRGFAIHQSDEFWQFGFYRYEWAIAALLSLEKEAPASAQMHWVRGLLFGYDSASIDRFISSSVSAELKSTSHYFPDNCTCLPDKVALYGQAGRLVPLHSNLTDKCRIRR
jgi:hypothetical protein